MPTFLFFFRREINCPAGNRFPVDQTLMFTIARITSRTPDLVGCSFWTLIRKSIRHSPLNLVLSALFPCAAFRIPGYLNDATRLWQLFFFPCLSSAVPPSQKLCAYSILRE